MKDDQRVVLTKRLLKEGLFRLLQTKDIGKIGVTELCRESGINRATFYRHFEQPRDILNEIRHDIFCDVKRIFDNGETRRETLKKIEDACTYIYENAELINLLLGCRTDAEFVEFINEMYERSDRLRRMNSFRGIDDESGRLAAYYYAGGIYYMLRRWLLEPAKKTPDEMAALIYGLLTAHAAESR